MKQKKEEKGITLIALIVSILVLVILVGVTIKVVVNTGILENAKAAVKKWEKEQVVEIIKLAMFQVKTDNPAEEFSYAFVEKTAQNIEGNHLHSLEQISENMVLGKWKDQYMVYISENEVIVEDLEEKVKIRENVEQMKKDRSLVIGDTVRTTGYYRKDDKGAGTYKIIASTNRTIDEGRVIQLENGLLAELEIENQTINVKQYGAYADGIHDDTGRIRLAFQQMNTEECNHIQFVKGTYVVTESIDMYSGTYSGDADAKIEIRGFTEGKEYVFQNASGLYGSTIDTVNVDSLNISVNIESQHDRHHVNIFRFYHTDGSQIKNCHFSTEEGNGIGVCSIDLYSDNHNMVIEDCNSYLYGIEQALNTHISVREFRSYHTTDHITIRNCDMEKSGRDESLWIDAWVGTLEHVEITNCNIRDVGVSSSTIYLGARQVQAKANDITLHNCNIEKEQFSYGLIKIAQTEDEKAGCTQNVRVYDNRIEIKSELASGILGGTAICMIGQWDRIHPESRDISIENNTFLSEETQIGTVIFEDGGRYITKTIGNQVKVNHFSTRNDLFNAVYSGLNEVNGDSFSKTNGEKIECSYLFRNCKTIRGVKGEIQGKFLNDYHNKVDEVMITDCDVTVSDVVFNIITTSTNLYTVRVENCKFNNNGNLAGVWYTDLNSASLSSGEGMVVVKKNVTTNRNWTYGTITVKEEN